MPTFDGTLTFTKAEFDATVDNARRALPGAERLKSLTIEDLEGKLKAVFDLPVIGDVAVEAGLKVTEAG